MPDQVVFFGESMANKTFRSLIEKVFIQEFGSVPQILGGADVNWTLHLGWMKTGSSSVQRETRIFMTRAGSAARARGGRFSTNCKCSALSSVKGACTQPSAAQAWLLVLKR
jgi:hypothetical protein